MLRVLPCTHTPHVALWATDYRCSCFCQNPLRNETNYFFSPFGLGLHMHRSAPVKDLNRNSQTIMEADLLLHGVTAQINDHWNSKSESSQVWTKAVSIG